LTPGRFACLGRMDVNRELNRKSERT
jgi:hypothetical protein